MQRACATAALRLTLAGMTLAASHVRHGRVRARYFRENFAQGGIDLVQIVPELVTNADAAIAAAGGEKGRITLSFARPDADFVALWKRELKTLKVPAVMSWTHELRCTDDGEGVDAATVDRRLGALGVEPSRRDQRGLFGRGLRDVWLAQGGGRIEGVREERAVESWFFPAAGDDPYAFVHVRDEPASDEARKLLGVARSGTRVTVPLAARRLPSHGRLRTLVGQLVQLRPVLDDSSRELWLELPGETAQLVTFPAPRPDPERPVLFDDEVTVATGVTARVVVRRAAEPFTLGPSRSTRLGGLVVRSGRAAHESTLAGHEGTPGARRLYGEVWCEALERLQRQALHSPRPQVVVRVDRSGLNEHHPVVRRLYAAVDRVLKPIVAEEERRTDAHLIAPGRAIRALDQEGLRALNEALRAAFDKPGSAGFRAGGSPAEVAAEGSNGGPPGDHPQPPEGAGPDGALRSPMRFKQSPIRLHPGERRVVSLLFDPSIVIPGTAVTALAEEGVRVSLGRDEVPPPGARAWSAVRVELRAPVSATPGARLTVLAEAGRHTAELEILVVRHTSSGWVREIVRKDEDSQVEAEFDPDTGTVVVYQGRREFRVLERAARNGGIGRRRVREYLPYRMLEVEVAANAVYAWAAHRIVERRLAEEQPLRPADYAGAIRLEAQALRYRFHVRLMRAFLDPAVFEGRVRVEERPGRGRSRQTSLA